MTSYPVSGKSGRQTAVHHSGIQAVRYKNSPNPLFSLLCPYNCKGSQKERSREHTRERKVLANEWFLEHQTIGSDLNQLLEMVGAVPLTARLRPLLTWLARLPRGCRSRLARCWTRTCLVCRSGSRTRLGAGRCGGGGGGGCGLARSSQRSV